MNNKDNLLSSKEVANLFKVEISKLNKWDKNGTLKPIKLKNRRFYSKQQLQEFVKNKIRNNTVKFKIPYPQDKKSWCAEYGLNSIYAGKHWSKRSKDKEVWKSLIKWQLKKDNICPKLYINPIKISFFWNDNLDLDNHGYLTKLIIDALKGYLIEDDNKNNIYEIRHRFYEENHILVVIEDFNK